MNKEDLNFVNDMVKQLDETIQKLIVEEKGITAKLGDDRTEELREYWQQELDEEETLELKSTFDYWDEMLIVSWAHAARAHTTRAEVGRTLMKESNNKKK